MNSEMNLSSMQTEKSQSEGERIMPETRFTEFSALSVHPRVGISRSALDTDDRLFFLTIIGKSRSFTRLYSQIMWYNDQLRT